MLKITKMLATLLALVCALAPAVQAQPVEGNWDNLADDGVTVPADVNWSTGANWWPDLPDGTLPGKPHLVTTNGYPNPADSIMDIDTRSHGLANVDVKDGIHLSVENYLKVTNSIYITSLAVFTVASGGTVEGNVRVVSNPGHLSEIVFSGGACAGGLWQTPDNRQELIYRINGSTSGLIAPTAFVNNDQSGTFYDSVPLFHFVMDAGGVTPIQPSGSDPVQVGSGSPPMPFDLTISGISTYAGPFGDIPLVSFTGGTDADRMFHPDRITFEDLPEDWTATVLQTDSGVTLNLTQPTPDLPGDANDNGFVDDDDLAVLLSNWEQDPGTITTWELGDFTADTDVDDDDLAVLLGNWTGSPPGGAAVPEPATLALLGLGGLAAIRRRRK